MNDFWEQLDPGFFEPAWLVVGIVALIAIVLLEAGARRRRRQAIRLFAAQHLIPDLTRSVSPGRRLAKRILLLIAVGSLFVALARPHLYYAWREENRTGLDTLIAVDCSKSMLSEDVKPSRLERAKLAIADFAEHLPDNRMGLIAFAGDAFLQCPLTIDHDAFLNAVRELDTDTIPRPGTDIATAIDEAVLASKSQSSNLKLLILVTDGEDLEGRVIEAAKKAAQSGLKIYTIGVGTAQGDTIPARDDSGAISLLHDSGGQLVQTKLDENTLRQIASVTGGAYEPMGQNGEGLEQIYDRYIAPLPKQKLEERREKIRFERYEWPLALSILFLTWSFLIGERAAPTLEPVIPGTVRRPVPRPKRKTAFSLTPLLLTGFWLVNSSAGLRAASLDQAEKDYKSGQYQDAEQSYKEAATQEPNRSDIHYNVGDAAYKAGEFTTAEEAFRQTLETPDLDLQEKTYYNLGNTQFKHGEAMQKVDTKKTMGLWEQALHSYESSLKLKNSADAKHNYEVVKKKLEQLKQQQEQQDQQQSKNNQDQQGQPKDQAGKDPSSKADNKQDPQSKDANNPQDESQQPDQQKKDPQGQPKMPQPDKNEPPPSSADDPNKTQARAHSLEREQDQKDPGVKSREDAEALLDSLKDDERHVTARTLNANNEPPPPPSSGKDW